MISTVLACGLLLGFAGSMPIAGPVAVIVLESALCNRGRDGLAVAIGAAIAESLYALLAFWGMAAVFAHNPALVPASRIVCGLLLVGIGAYIFFRRGGARPIAQRAARFPGGRITFGFVISVLNPTLLATWVTAVAILHALVDIELKPANAIAFAASACVGIVIWFVLLVALVRRFGSHFGQAALNRFSRGIGVALVVLGAGLAGRALWTLARAPSRHHAQSTEPRRVAQCSFERDMLLRTQLEGRHSASGRSRRRTRQPC
jgi:threonine/homoserine/homoserine lactone efflux protein